MHKYELLYLDLELRRTKNYKERIELIEGKYLCRGCVTDALLRHYKRIKRVVSCVEEALQELSPLHREFFYLYYEKGKNMERIAIEMRLTPYTVENLRKDILTTVAEKMGFVEEPKEL